jgi:hypothetical protein
MCDLGDVQVFSRICCGLCSRKTKVDFGIFACSSLQEGKELIELIIETACLRWYGRIVRICIDPVTCRACIRIIILHKEDIERNRSNHIPHLVVWNNALRSTRDQVLFRTGPSREVAHKASNHSDIELLFA